MALTKATRLATAEAQLASVQSSILRAVKAQAYTVGGSTVQRQQLDTLRTMEKELESKILALQTTTGSSGGTLQAVFQ